MFLVEYLTSGPLIRLQVLFYLYIVGCYVTFRETYESIYLKVANEYLRSKREESGFNSSLNDVNQKKVGTIDKETSIHLKTGCPVQLHFICIWLRRLSTLTLLAIAFKIIMPLKYIISYVDLPLPAHCYIPGRFILHNDITQMLELIFTVWTMSWRIAAQRRRFLNLRMIIFMLQEEDDLEKFYRLFEGKGCEGSIPESKDDIYQHYLRYIMCYPVEYEDKLIYRLRVTQTPAARSILARQITRCTIFVTISFLILTAFIFPIITTLILSDYAYTERYPGCDPDLEKLLQLGQLNFWSFTPHKHHLTTISFDILENLILWVEAGIILIYAIPFSYILNCNLKLHWSTLQKKLDHHVNLLKLRWFLDDQSIDEILTSKMLVVSIGDPQLKHIDYSNELTIVNLQNQLIENQTVEIQAEVQDFFFQIRTTDVYASDILSFGVIVWFMFFEGIAYSASLEGGLSLNLISAGAFGFCLFTIISFHLLALNKATHRMYNTLCSIMAFDRSNSREKYNKILDFYHEPNRSCYTILRQIPYAPTTYLTVIGWTISCAVISENIWSRARLNKG